MHDNLGYLAQRSLISWTKMGLGGETGNPGHPDKLRQFLADVCSMSRASFTTVTLVGKTKTLSCWMG